MKKHILFYIVIFVTTLNLFAEPPFKHGTLKGIVVNSETNHPIAGANVMIANTSIGTSTNLRGHFKIRHVPTGEITLKVSMIGFKTVTRKVNITHRRCSKVKIKMSQTLLKMGSVVVTGTGTPHTIEDAPVKTKLISRLDIEQSKSSNVAEALMFQPGVNVTNDCQNCNFTQVKILGMDGKYSQILIDGDPVVSSLAGVYGLEHYPAEMLDRMEITKGGGSALYGGGAVAGVINLVTRRPKVNQSRIKYKQSITDENSGDYHLGITSEMISQNGKSGAYLFASTRTRDQYDRNGDGFSELGQLKNESLGVNWFYNPIEDGELSTHLHRIHEFRRGGNDFELPSHEANISESVEHWKWGGTAKWKHQFSERLDYKVFYSFALTNRKSYYGGTGPEGAEDFDAALKAYGRTENPLHIGGITANYLLGNHLLTAGLQYSHDHVKDNSTANPLYYIDNNFINAGFFLQDNFHFASEKLELVIGSRFDNHSEINQIIISPRLNIKYKFHRDFVFRSGYSTGFKAPQIYDEDLHICGLEGGQKIIRNSDDLTEEKSHSLTAGLDYNGYIGKFGVMAGITGYYTKIQDAFSTEFSHSEGRSNIWYRINQGGASISGVEIETGIQPNSAIEIIANVTFTDGQYEEQLEDWGTTDFLRTPDISGNLALSATLTSDLSISLKGKYLGKAQIPHEGKMKLIESDSFIRTDFYANYKLSFLQDFNAKVTLGVRNLMNAYQEDLDVGADRDPAYVYGPALPRSLFFNIETNF